MSPREPTWDQLEDIMDLKIMGKPLVFLCFLVHFSPLAPEMLVFLLFFLSFSVKMLIFLWILKRNRLKVIKNIVFLKVAILKSATVQAISRVKITKYQFYNIKQQKNDTEAAPPEPAEPPDPDRELQFGTYHPHAPESG